MNENTQLNLFLTAIKNSAAEEIEGIDKETERVFSIAIDSAKKDTDKRIANYYESEITEFRREQNTILAKAKDDFHYTISEIKKSLKSEIRSIALEKLINYTNSDEYKEKLKEMLDKSNNMFGGNEVIRCRSNDIDLLKTIASNQNISVDDNIKIGGIISECIEKGIIIDQTIDKMLEEQISILTFDEKDF
ncbi:V-type proton ATPase subunit E [Eubacteriales bacterium OttesenSCG-928-G02]|nr:V-type proton ATPase subunit E [Eubacteriales bacterium OttesenSCG-928-G02]